MSVKTILTSTRGFVRSSAFLITTLALAAALPMASSAATPLAVWDGDFSVTQTGFTLNRSGNAISQDNSTITIDQDVGVKVDFTTGVNAMTVMFKYSDLSFDAQKTIATSFCSGYDENRTGVYLASGGKANGIWNTDDWGNEMGTLSASSGVLAFCYSKSAGTALYYVSAGSRTQLYNKSNLVASNDAAINGCTLGGERAKTGATLLSAATGMKISAIAIFNSGLDEAEMTGYEWPSDGATIIKSDTTVSAINSQVGDAAEIKLKLSSGVKITMDEAFTASTVKLVSSGNIMLAADAQPSAEELVKLDLAGVYGAVKRSWLSPDVIGFNFNSDAMASTWYGPGSGAGNNTSSALAKGTWYANGSDKNSTTNICVDLLTKISWSANAVWNEVGAAMWGATFVQTYLDDNGQSPRVNLTALPYDRYDVVIYCSAGTENNKFHAKKVNGQYYTWDAGLGQTVSGNTPWGAAKISATPIYGTNAIRVNNLSGPLSIEGGARSGTVNGCISAIQIIPADVEIDATNGYVPDATRLENIRKDYREVTIKGYGDNGATLNYGSTTNTFTSHIVFDGGVHSVTYSNSGTKDIAFAQNTAAPVFETTNGAILNLYSIDLSGWQGNAQNKVPYSNILVGEGTMLNLTPSEGSESRTFYYQGRFTIEPGATLKTSYTHQNSVFRLNGGAYEGCEQIYVPASELGSGHAVITGVDGNTGLRLPADDTVGVGIFVGGNSALDFDIAITSAGSAPIGKWGDGVVNFNGDLSGYQGTLAIHEGTVFVSTATTLGSVTVDEGAILAYSYDAKPTISFGSMAGTIVVDVSSLVSGGVIESGTYQIAPAGIPAYRVVVTGLPENSGFSVSATANDGVVLSDQEVFSPEWTGASGTWSANQFNGKTGSTDGLDVSFSQGTTPLGEVTVVVDGEKSVNAASFVARDTAYTLYGDQITTTDGITVSGVAPVVISNKLVVGGSVVLNAGTELTLANNEVSLASGALSGSGTLVLDPGEGNAFTMSTANTSYTGEAVVASGTVKMGDAQSFGVVTKDSAIRVKGGATFDANHAEATSTYYAENGHKLGLILESGATFTSSTQKDDRKLSAVSTLTLEGDAIVDATVADVSISLHLNWDYTHINLGANTLRKKGNNTFWISACNIDGTGVFHVEEGSVTICESYYGTRPGLFTEGTLRLDTGASFNMVHYYQVGKYPVFTVKNLELNGTVTRQAGTDATNSTLTVTGYVTGNGTTPMLTLGANAIFKPTGTGYLTITESLTLPTSTVGEGDNAEEVPYMVIDLTDALASGTTLIPLFKVGSTENLPDAENIGFIYPGQTTPSQTLPRGWNLSKTLGGCGYKLSKGSFSIHLR